MSVQKLGVCDLGLSTVPECGGLSGLDLVTSRLWNAVLCTSQLGHALRETLDRSCYASGFEMALQKFVITCGTR